MSLSLNIVLIQNPLRVRYKSSIKQNFTAIERIGLRYVICVHVCIPIDKLRVDFIVSDANAELTNEYGMPSIAETMEKNFQLSVDRCFLFGGNGLRDTI